MSTAEQFNALAIGIFDTPVTQDGGRTSSCEFRAFLVYCSSVRPRKVAVTMGTPGTIFLHEDHAR